MKTTDVEYFKKKLARERILLDEEMKSVGRNSSTHPKEWQATVDDSDIDTADENEVADKLEELEEHQSILKQLTKQSEEVDAALKKIEDKTFGICETCNGAIEKERLEANTSARTCIKHMNDGQKIVK